MRKLLVLTDVIDLFYNLLLFGTLAHWTVAIGADVVTRWDDWAWYYWDCIFGFAKFNEVLSLILLGHSARDACVFMFRGLDSSWGCLIERFSCDNGLCLLLVHHVLLVHRTLIADDKRVTLTTILVVKVDLGWWTGFRVGSRKESTFICLGILLPVSVVTNSFLVWCGVLHLLSLFHWNLVFSIKSDRIRELIKGLEKSIKDHSIKQHT